MIDIETHKIIDMLESRQEDDVDAVFCELIVFFMYILFLINFN